MWLARRPALLRKVLSLGDAGYLADVGWSRSVVEQRPVDAQGCPIPWVTLPFIDFITERLRSSFKLLEFGSGASTFYYSARVLQVDSIEHDAGWHAQLTADMPTNARVALVPLDYDGAYARAGGTWGERYDLVIVDGRDRVNCLRQAVQCITDGGCLVLDDSEREGYRSGCDALAEQGFKRLNFWGIAPGLTYKKCTTVFYKDGNCLGI